MKKCKLILHDEVNASFEDLPIEIRKKLNRSQKFKKFDAIYSAKVRFGGWDGTVSFFSMGGHTYINILPEIIPMLEKEGYFIEIVDNRKNTPDFLFDPVDKDYINKHCPNPVWPENHPIAGEPIELRDYQVEAINKFLENKSAVGEISTSAGKAQPMWSNVLTPNGFKKMQDIKLGDEVLTPRFTKTIVTGVFPQGKRDIYEIRLMSGRTVYSCAEHLWKIKVNDIEQVLQLSEIINLENNRVLFPILGIDNNKNDIMVDIPDIIRIMYPSEPHIRPYNDIKSFFVKCMLKSKQSATAATSVVLGGIDYELAQAYVKLGRSVGFDFYIERNDTNQITTYDVLKGNYSDWVPVITIRKFSEEDCQCIMVEDEDHLYITDDYVITHNTIMTSVLSHNVEKYGRSLVIVPNKDLVAQTYGDYKNIGLDVGMYYGDQKDIGKKHTICTWQSLEAMRKNSGKLDKITITEFLKDVVAVIVDEAHTISGEALKDLLCGPLSDIPIRWGLTGTVPKQDIEKRQMEISIGPKVHNLTAKELIDKGVLSKCFIDIIQLKEYISFTQWPDEQKFLATDKNRIKWIAEFAKEVSKSGNTLILVNNIDTGKMLEELIPDLDFIYGKIKSKDRKKKYDSIAKEDNTIFAANYQVASTGINIPRIFNLILLDVGKSYTRVIQSIGRGIRKASDKDTINVYDINSALKSSKKQLKERKKFYDYVEYPYEEFKINYISELENNKFLTAQKMLSESLKRRT